MRSRISAAVTLLVVLAAVLGGLGRTLDAKASAVRQGIDVSSFQGLSIGWHSVAASGISFAYIRAADGAGYPNSPDGAFGINWRGATAAGVTPGAYLFFEPAQNPVAQANLLVAQLHAVGFTHGDLIPAIDVETTGGQPRAVVVANLRTVVDTVGAAIGSLPAIYSSPSWWTGNIGSSAFTLDPLWVANWFVSSPSVPENNWGGTGWQVWQYSDAGTVPGIPGRVDLDQCGTRSLPYYGWPDPVALAATNVASAPQTVSDQPGDIDVLWHGTNGHLWTLGYRNGAWRTAATDVSGAAAPSTANLVTDPSVVSSGAGRIDAFWEGSDGNIWQATYTAGWYGNGSWSAPRALGVGPVGSAPEAVSPGAGLIDLFWKGVGSAIWVDRFNGRWSGPSPLGSGVVTGTPVAEFGRRIRHRLLARCIEPSLAGHRGVLGLGRCATADHDPARGGSIGERLRRRHRRVLEQRWRALAPRAHRRGVERRSSARGRRSCGEPGGGGARARSGDRRFSRVIRGARVGALYIGERARRSRGSRRGRRL